MVWGRVVYVAGAGIGKWMNSAMRVQAVLGEVVRDGLEFVARNFDGQCMTQVVRCSLFLYTMAAFEQKTVLSWSGRSRSLELNEVQWITCKIAYRGV